MTGDRWALIDVETSGLSSRHHRVLSLAVLTMDGDAVVDEYSSTFDPGCDPGPVHVHRLTRERLRGSPTFDSTHPRLTRLLQGRTLVAHNASFDHGFLSAEMDRLSLPSPTAHRMCTMTLARRLQLDVPNVKLATLAAYWGIRQRSAHDALDDVRTLSEIFVRSVALAHQLGLELPITACAPAARGYPGRHPRAVCPWRNPGKFDETVGLFQGTKVVITGATNTPRSELAGMMTDLGLDVMNSVSGKTGLVVCNDPGAASRKLRTAVERGIPVLDERAVMRLLERVRPGVPLDSQIATATPTVMPPTRPSPTPAPETPPLLPAPYAGRRVLVIGGTHLEATVMRSRLVQLGATPAINLTAGVTDVLVLDGGDGDPRMPKVSERALRLLTMPDVDAALDMPSDDPPETPRDWVPPILAPGAVIDLPDAATQFTMNVAWRADVVAADVDVVAFELGEDGRVLSDDEFVFYNQPASPDGAVAVSIDGDCEQGVHVDLASVAADVHRIVIGAAIGNDATFGQLGALSVTADTSEATVATAVLDGATTERSMIVAEIYRRGAIWRLRALGQGYEHGLAAFAGRYGVDVEE